MRAQSVLGYHLIQVPWSQPGSDSLQSYSNINPRLLFCFFVDINEWIMVESVLLPKSYIKNLQNHIIHYNKM